jgi:PAS domain S-box-containing protein
MDGLANAPSLLNYLDAPVVVADPDGRVVFLNPAFEFAFATSRERTEGRALAALFEGGDREAVLAAVATACARGQSVRFRIRHQERGFQVLASPIAVEGQRVGAVLLLTEDPLEADALLRVKRGVERAADQLAECLEHLGLPDAKLGPEERHDWMTSARGALAECRRAAGSLGRLADNQERQRSREATIDPARVVRDAVAGVSYEMAEAGVSVDVLVASELPLVRGDAKRLQEALEALLRARLAQGPDWINLAAREVEAGQDARVELVITDPGPARGPGAPPLVADTVAALGGRLSVEVGDGGERATHIRLPAI